MASQIARTIGRRYAATRSFSAVATIDTLPEIDESFGAFYQGANVQSSTLANGVTVISTDAGPVATVGVKLGVGASTGPASAAFAAAKMVRTRPSLSLCASLCLSP